MIEVEDKDPKTTEDLTVGLLDDGHTGNVVIRYLDDSGLSVAFHKDTWPALKEAIETTLKQMEATPVITNAAERETAALIIDEWCCNTGGYTRQFGEKLLDALERGYV